MTGDGRLSLSSGLWRNTDGTLPHIARSSVTSASAPSPELTGHEGQQSLTSGHGATRGCSRAASDALLRSCFPSLLAAGISRLGLLHAFRACWLVSSAK